LRIRHCPADIGGNQHSGHRVAFFCCKGALSVAAASGERKHTRRRRQKGDVIRIRQMKNAKQKGG